MLTSDIFVEVKASGGSGFSVDNRLGVVFSAVVRFSVGVVVVGVTVVNVVLVNAVFGRLHVRCRAEINFAPENIFVSEEEEKARCWRARPEALKRCFTFPQKC